MCIGDFFFLLIEVFTYLHFNKGFSLFLVFKIRIRSNLFLFLAFMFFLFRWKTKPRGNVLFLTAFFIFLFFCCGLLTWLFTNQVKVFLLFTLLRFSFDNVKLVVQLGSKKGACPYKKENRGSLVPAFFLLSNLLVLCSDLLFLRFIKLTHNNYSLDFALFLFFCLFVCLISLSLRFLSVFFAIFLHIFVTVTLNLKNKSARLLFPLFTCS